MFYLNECYCENSVRSATLIVNVRRGCRSILIASIQVSERRFEIAYIKLLQILNENAFCWMLANSQLIRRRRSIRRLKERRRRRR